MKKLTLLISCEHAVNTIPKEYLKLFSPFKELLATHEGKDIGALKLSQYLHKKLSCPLIRAKTSRLLIDCNRSLSHNHCFSKITKSLVDYEKQRIVKKYYLPYRRQVFDLIQRQLNQKLQVLHLSIHSFTPIFHGKIREADIGLLYDPKRSQETYLVHLWQTKLNESSELYIRRNYPYKGISDGLTTALRKVFPNDQYMGIEVEINQALFQDNKLRLVLQRQLVETLLPALELFGQKYSDFL